MSVLARRVAKIESVMNPPPPAPVHLLAEPVEGDPPEAWERYDKELAEAKAAGGRIIVLCPLEKEDANGVEYRRDKFDAYLEVAAARRSENGKGTQLDEVLGGLSGKVLGVAQVAPR